MERKTLKLALEALKHLIGNQSLHYTYRGKAEKAITAIKQALAQPAQEPVCPDCKAGVLYECVACSSNNYPAKPAQEPVGYVTRLYPVLTLSVPVGSKLYTTPPQRKEWQGLTDEERVQVLHSGDKEGYLEYAKGIEAKLKEKNA
jgi:hypothetical protein